eukprot:232872_1
MGASRSSTGQNYQGPSKSLNYYQDNIQHLVYGYMHQIKKEQDIVPVEIIKIVQSYYNDLHEYSSILINRNRNKLVMKLGKLLKKKAKISSHSTFAFNESKCPRCNIYHSLKYMASYCAAGGTYSIEYHCTKCKCYIVHQLKKKWIHDKAREELMELNDIESYSDSDYDPDNEYDEE